MKQAGDRSAAPVLQGLGEASWSEHRLGEQRIVRGSWQVPAATDIWAWLSRGQDWAFCWRSRESPDLWVGKGALLRWDQEGSEDIAGPHGLTIFGGRPFAEESPGLRSELWGELQESQWFLPRVLVRCGHEGWTLWVHECVNEAQPIDRASLEKVARDCLAACQGLRSSQPLPPFLHRSDKPSQASWIAAVERAVAAMQAVRFEKVVMSRSVCLSFAENPDWLALIQALLAVEEEAFVFALKTPSARVFLGRSPERILAWDQEGFALDAIAGTRRRMLSQSADQEEGRDLQDSPKERLEHRLVSDTIAQILSGAGLRYAALEEQQILQLKHVQHMRTRFSGPWNEAEKGLPLLELLHPTPAVGGVPRPAALQFLREEEGYDRGWFAGYIGMIHEDAGEFAIGIRSALIAGRALHVFAGAGIVAASDPYAEWQETELKMQNFLSLFAQERREYRTEARAETF